MGRIIAWMFALWVFAGVQWAEAVKVENLYRASFNVEDQTPERREKLAAEGLLKVLVKVSGSHNLPDSSQLGVVSRQANRYLQQFSYENADEGYQLNLDYAKGAVDTLLRKLELPIWPDKRPEVLLWLVQDDFQQRQMLNLNEQETLFNAAKIVETDRGLPLALPLMDLDDRVALPTAAAWSLNEQSLEQASSRYQSDVSLLGRMSITGSGQWLASWLLMDRGKLQLFDGRGANPEEIVANGLNQVADYLASQHAIVASPLASKPYYMQLDNIADFQSYRKVLDYLNGLAMVRYAEPELVLGEQLRLRLFIDGQLQQLVDAIALDKILQANSAVGEARQQGVMYYQLPQPENNVLQPLVPIDGEPLNEQGGLPNGVMEKASDTETTAIDASQAPQPPQLP
ncbi:DUF2066 domain-containing protein [Pseudoteredinibacter isoporae]|uniref:DUF2066 domain-containing protein n=1 Tax=Pseudoteredinibacter isoporae TaxID=570281 RepID=A0A7X0MVW9_9GAMM|nr:hypothetical protein [Pseudoteredinibacter isoporae]NHO87701.1 DUF2066 domain-containing protein [Pseudoteredinibacter isoporae]NIB23968.1 DUF2066 domain-containing protein [Pseudoteredinibacter isoporae]